MNLKNPTDREVIAWTSGVLKTLDAFYETHHMKIEFRTLLRELRSDLDDYLKFDRDEDREEQK